MANEKTVILTVDRNKRNLELLAQFLLKEGYEIVPVSSLEDFDQILADDLTFNLALVDITGFDRGIWDYCEQLSAKGIPLLVISLPQGNRIQEESITHGAQGVLFKPLAIKELSGLIRTMTQRGNDE